MPKLAGDEPGNSRPAQVTTIQSVEAVKFAGGTLRAQVYNENPSGSGNDAALDNLRILDVSPSLEKSFDPAVNTVGDTAKLTLSVTNTTDLAAKNGWTFTDTLTPGLRVVDGTGAVTACVDIDGQPIESRIVATANGDTIAVEGDLADQVAQCNITVEVIAGEGTFVNGPGNIKSDFLKTDKLTDVEVGFGLPSDEPEIERTPFNTPVTLEPFGNFQQFTDDETPTTADKSTFLFDNGTTSQETAEGTWEYDVTTGLITFTPVDGYTGTTPALPYSYKDSNGNTVNSTATVIVGGDIIDHEKRGELGQHVTVKIEGETENVDLTTMELIDPETGEPTTDPVVVPGEGTWTVDQSTGSATFTPEEGFESNPTPIKYVADDSSGVPVEPAWIKVTYPEVVPTPTPTVAPTQSPEPTQSPDPEVSPEPTDTPAPEATPAPSSNPSPENTPGLSPTGGMSPIASPLAAFGLLLAGAVALLIRARRSHSA